MKLEDSGVIGMPFSRRRFLGRAAAVMFGAALLGEVDVARGAATIADSEREALTALILLVAASPELRGAEIDEAAATGRLVSMYSASEARQPGALRAIASALDDADRGSFARSSHRERQRRLQAIAGRSGFLPQDGSRNQRAVALGLRRAAEAITGRAGYPEPTYTIAPGVVMI